MEGTVERQGAPLSHRFRCLGWLALSIFGWMLALVAFVGTGVMLMAPSEPRPGNPAAFVDAGDGRIGVALGPSAARELTSFHVTSTEGPTSFAARDDVIWEIERTGDVPDSWSGPIVIGEVPPGFSEIQPLRPFPARWEVSGYGGCSRGLEGSVPAAPLRTDQVAVSWGDVDESLSSFVARDQAFRPCDPAWFERPGIWVGLVGVAIGVVAILAAMLRPTPGPHAVVYGETTPRDHSLFEP